MVKILERTVHELPTEVETGAPTRFPRSSRRSSKQPMASSPPVRAAGGRAKRQVRTVENRPNQPLGPKIPPEELHHEIRRNEQRWRPRYSVPTNPRRPLGSSWVPRRSRVAPGQAPNDPTNTTGRACSVCPSKTATVFTPGHRVQRRRSRRSILLL